MADLDQLKQKYSPVIQTIEGFSDLGAKVDTVSLDGEKLYLKGSVPSEVVANRVWDVIKQVDPTYSDLHHEIATTGGPNQSYSVKSGDNLSKISNRFYGSPNHYSNIAAASNIPIQTRSRWASKSLYLCLPRTRLRRRLRALFYGAVHSRRIVYASLPSKAPPEYLSGINLSSPFAATSSAISMQYKSEAALIRK